MENGKYRFKRHKNNFRKPRRDNNSSSDHGGDWGNDQRAVKKAMAAREKYIGMAKDALSSGDRVLSENYLQHADHYLRIINSAEPQYRQQRFDSSVQENSPVQNAAEPVSAENAGNTTVVSKEQLPAFITGGFVEEEKEAVTA